MNETKDSYLKEVVDTGDKASDIMNSHCRQTLKNRDEIQVIDPSMGGLVVVRPNDNYNMLAFSISANPNIKDNENYVRSFFSKAKKIAKSLDGEVIAVSDILDFNKITVDLTDEIGSYMEKYAKTYDVAIINGEIAGLGERVTVPFNLSGTALCYVPKSIKPGYIDIKGVEGFVFNSNKKPVWMNSDGEGTKTELSERLGRPLSMHNVFPMTEDDAAKIDADIILISSVMDILKKDKKTYEENFIIGKVLAKSQNIAFTLQPEVVKERISGYGENPRNFNATAVSLIDEEKLRNLPRPKEGHSLIVVRNPKNPNSRSNGYSKLRAGCKEMFGEEWHNAEYQGKNVGEMVGANSELFYPYVKELFRQGLISGFFHMSGGSHKGKLARPLSKHGLHCLIEEDRLFPIPLHERKINEHFKMPPSDSYATFPCGNDAYFTAEEKNAWPAQQFLRSKGYETRTAAILEAKELGKRGVTIKHALCDINYLF
jgi:phosphoribosylaminoimidazole (AIR) synthetase